jgi:hypothetical protein
MIENVQKNAIVLMKQCVIETNLGPTYERTFKPKNHKLLPMNWLQKNIY